jgi:hypothetical protein
VTSMPRPSAPRRDADNELYGFGSDLVEAARGISRIAADPEAAPAVPALLGCIEATLEELSGACRDLQRAHAENPPEPSCQAVAERLDRGYTNLRVALQDARDASRAARALAARRGTTR